MLVGSTFLFHPTRTDEVFSSAKHTGRELDKRSVATKTRLFIVIWATIWKPLWLDVIVESRCVCIRHVPVSKTIDHRSSLIRTEVQIVRVTVLIH